MCLGYDAARYTSLRLQSIDNRTMSLDPSSFPRSNSPASSDSSLTRSRLRGKEGSLKKDKNYRRYASSVERALSLFDNTLQEWADYISFLSRLLKALQSHPPDLPVVPHKALVAKRLAQSMNPSLPSGVHQKALEVYTYIFNLIKPEGLSHDLPLYYPGIAPTLTFASLTVRPLFLSLVETYVCDLEPWAIRPALKAIILSLLPGLEEETSDDFEPTMRLINTLREIASRMDTQRPGAETNSSGQYFWQCFFLASITSPSRRLGVLAYLNRYLPKLGITDRRPSVQDEADTASIPHDMRVAVDSVILPEPGLLIRCFATGLTDEQVLVQRNFLDLLVTHLPLSSPILQSRITGDDLQRLIVCASGVVARRDMSLNRRLWAWLLGPDPVSDRGSFDARPSTSGSSKSENHELSQSQYFSRFGLQSLVNGLLQMLQKNVSVPSEKVRPFRITLSLMDRWEVGGHVVPAVFLPFIRSVQAYEQTASKPHFDEVFRSATSFFDGVESGMIFSELLNLIDWDTKNLARNMSKTRENLNLAHFILDHFNVREEDMVLNHVPLLTLAALIKMSELSSEATASIPRDQLQFVATGLSKVITSLSGLLIDRAFLRKPDSKNSVNGQPLLERPGLAILRRIHQFYDQSRNSLDPQSPPFSPRDLADFIIKNVYEQAISAVDAQNGTISVSERLNLLTVVLKKLPRSRVLRDKRLYLAINSRIKAATVASSTASFSLISAVSSTITSLYCIHKLGYYISYENVSDLIPLLVKQLWQFLSPLSPKFHVEAVRCLWNLHSISWADHLVESSITSLMFDSPAPGLYQLSSEEEAGRFFILWNHSHHGTYELPPKHLHDSAQAQTSYHSSMLERPLFTVLDLLSQGPTQAGQVVQLWLQDLPSIAKVFRIVIARLEGVLQRGDQLGTFEGNTVVSPDDHSECNYLLETIHNTLSALAHSGWVALLTQNMAQHNRRHDISASEDNAESPSLHSTIFQASLKVVSGYKSNGATASAEEVKLQQISLVVMRQLLLGPGVEELVESGIDSLLVDRLVITLDEGGDVAIQAALIDTLLAVLKTRFTQAYVPPPTPKVKHQRAGSRDKLTSPSILSFTSDKQDKSPAVPQHPEPTQRLLDCLLKGISSLNSRPIIDKWIMLLCEILPLYSTSIFQILLTLVECLGKEIEKSYANLQSAFKQTESWPEDRSEQTTISLLAGFETCIAAAHERLLIEEVDVPVVKSPDQTHGSFFGNMVSGVFNSESNHLRSGALNNRLTVLLSFQDAVRLCFSIWSWGAAERSSLPQDTESIASFQYTSLRMRNRSRRILEHLFTAEALECLETMVDMWLKSDSDEFPLIFNLLHTLDGSRPKIAVPAIFNAIYTRTNPAALDPSRKSTMTTSLTESELAGFLVTYARSLDDDVLDEIWLDCTTFLRDVLSNPFPHRQLLPRLVEFAAILGAKLENTNFGEDRRMRKELGDILLRLLTAIFTSKPMGISQEQGLLSRTSVDYDNAPPHIGPDDMLSILAASMPAFTTTLGDQDRITTAVTGISTNVIGPFIRARLFPNNLNENFMILLQLISKIPQAAKIWKKDVAEAFNDQRFFGSHVDLVKSGWMNLLRQWVLVDKDRLSEIMSRLTPPATAGIMFGVGASAARLDADRKAQLNLRRISLLILSANDDYFISEMPALLQKLEDLLGATASSSPSSATRAEVFMVLRALTLKSTATTLIQFWPLLNSELQEAVSAISSGDQQELYNPYSLLQACKLLDTLLVLAPDDFQLLEWLYVTDTVDAVYPPERFEPMALADEVSHNLGVRWSTSSDPAKESSDLHRGVRHPGLTADWIRETAKDEIVDRVLRPFFDQLSIHAFESTYSISSPDLVACRDDLLADLFNESTMAN